MTRVQLLLGKVAEECNEVAQRALKAQQFGLNEVQEGQTLNNLERLKKEFSDLLVVSRMLEFDIDGDFTGYPSDIVELEKMQRVEDYIKLSQKLGMVGKK